jgi:hypothetical protein
MNNEKLEQERFFMLDNGLTGKEEKSYLTAAKKSLQK